MWPLITSFNTAIAMSAFDNCVASAHHLQLQYYFTIEVLISSHCRLSLTFKGLADGSKCTDQDGLSIFGGA